MPTRHEYTLNLWPDASIPFSTGQFSSEEEPDPGHFSNIQKPVITVFLPHREKAIDTAILICPGGGYWVNAWEKEGKKLAHWFNRLGITAAVLKYRLPTAENIDNKAYVPLTDGLQAMRFMRHEAVNWGFSPDKIGLMGFSAGGHLAASICTQFNYQVKTGMKNTLDSISARPDFSILIYPVISVTEPYSHIGSKEALIGSEPETELTRFFSPELNVTPQTASAFILHADDDGNVPSLNSIAYYQALKAHKIPAELHIFRNGGHGFGMDAGSGPVMSWPELLHQWLIAEGWLG